MDLTSTSTLLTVLMLPAHYKIPHSASDSFMFNDYGTLYINVSLS